MSTMNNKANFLSNKPQGEDLLDGQSQIKIADAIKKHIIEFDADATDVNKDDNDIALPRIIGVEGAWGSGKSNMLKKLEEKLEENGYFFFTYDAWGNQEDLQRRSILELLTQKLIDKEILIGETEITVLNTDLDKEPTTMTCTWKRRLFSLVSRKSTSHNVTIPKVESSTKAFALMLVVSAIAATMMGAMKPTNAPCWYSLLVLAGTLVPFLIFMLCKWIYGWDFDVMWKMYQTEGTKDTATYTISELEPSVKEFRDWMTDLEKSFAVGKRLVIVFDNMDRLPREKVRQLWSSIQTFFAGKGYNKVWCIIPFDRAHLANAFSEDKTPDKGLELTNYFIEKTFPMVYRIPDPIITDYRGVFDTLFEKAFGKRNEQETINRCYRLKKPKPNMREIISFINKCVSLEHTWGNEINLTSIAVFVLNSDIILNERTDQTIIDGEYIGVFGKIIEVNEELTTEISSLVYGVDKVQAAQLPLKNIVAKALSAKESANFGKLANEKKNFFIILDEETKDMDTSLLDTAIKQISDIDAEGITAKDQSLLEKVWKKMAELYHANKLNETTFRPEVKLLMSHCPGKALKERVGKKFLELFISGDKNEHKGEEWYSVYKEFSIFVNEKGLSLTLPEKMMMAGDYVAYVKAAKADYKNYAITTSNDDLNKDLLSRVADGIDILDVLRTIQGDERFSLIGLYEGSRAMIEGGTATDDNIESALNVCKELSKEPLNLKVKQSFLDQLTHTGSVKDDLQVLRALVGKDLIGLNDEDYAKMAQVAYSYVNTDELWDKTISEKTTVLAKMMAWLIVNNQHCGQFKPDKDMITGMANIHSKTGAEQQAIIKFVDEWGKNSLNEAENALILSSVLGSESWVSSLLADKNDFSKVVLAKYYKDFNAQPITTFIASNNTWANSTYWLKVLKILIDDPDFKSACKEKLIEITGLVVKGISTGNIVSGNSNQELQDKLLAWIQFEDISSKVSDALFNYANRQSAINKYMFKSLHRYLVKVKGAEAHFLNYALKPLINEEEVQQIVLDNLSDYESLIHNNISQASDLKDALIKLYNTTKNEEFKALIDRLGIIVHEEPSEDSEEVKDEKK